MSDNGPKKKKENELDPNAQLEKQIFAALDTNGSYADKPAVRFRGV